MIEILLILLCILFSACFSAAETAYTSLSLVQKQNLKKLGRRGVIAYNLANNSSQLVTTILIGNNIANILASTLTTTFIIDYFGHYFLGISTGIITLVILIFAEIFPKQVALVKNEQIALNTAYPLYLLTKIFNPLIKIVNFKVKLLLKIFKIEGQNKLLTKESIGHIISLAQNLGILKKDDGIFINKILNINEIKVAEIITHRREVFSLSSSLKLKDVLEKIKEEGYSRIPIYKGEDEEQIIGIILIKDIFLEEKSQKTLKNFVKPVLIIPNSKKVKDLLLLLKDQKQVMAVVLDEYGGFNGIVTLEDIIEKVFGSIYDESDEVENVIEKIKENVYKIKGTAKFDFIKETLNIDIEHQNYINTIGGYLTDLLGKIPNKDETVETLYGKFIINAIIKNKIESVIFIKKVENKETN